MSSSEKQGAKKKVYFKSSKFKQAAERVTAQASSSKDKSTSIKSSNYHNQETMEAHIDILYAKYLQAAYLDFQTKKTLEKRSGHALEKIYKLFCLVLSHLNKLQEEQAVTKCFSYLLKVFRHTQKQAEIFQPLLDVMPSLEIQYRSLAEAVNASKHKLPVKGILLPEPGSEDDVIQLLEETNNAISKFFQDFTNDQEICRAAEDMKNYIDVAEKISESLKKGTELVAEAQDLLLSEASLQLSEVHL